MVTKNYIMRQVPEEGRSDQWENKQEKGFYRQQEHIMHILIPSLSVLTTLL